MSIFSGIETAEVTGGSQYIQPGQHTLKVKSVTIRESKKVADKTYFIAEFTVMESSSESHTAGSTATWLVDMAKPTKETAYGNIKEFVIALLKCNADEVTFQLCDELVGASQPGVGMCVLAEAWHKPTTTGGVFTRISWSPVADDSVAN